MTPLAKNIHSLLKAGQADKARKLLPPERIYPVDADTMKQLGMKP